MRAIAETFITWSVMSNFVLTAATKIAGAW